MLLDAKAMYSTTKQKDTYLAEHLQKCNKVLLG